MHFITEFWQEDIHNVIASFWCSFQITNKCLSSLSTKYNQITSDTIHDDLEVNVNQKRKSNNYTATYHVEELKTGNKMS